MTAPATIDHQTSTAADTATQNAGRAAGFRAMLPHLARTVALPAASYYLVHALGGSDVVALLTGTAVSGVVMIAEAVRARRLDPFAAFMVGAFGIGLIGLLFTGDARFLIVKDSFSTLAIGAAFLVSMVIGKPLTFLAARNMVGGGNRVIEQQFELRYSTEPGMRATMKRMSAMWGVGLLTEGVVRIVLAYMLPISTMVWLSTVLMVATVGCLILVTKRMVAAAQRRAAVAPR